MRFSERMGFAAVREALQLHDMDSALRDSLLNVFYEQVWMRGGFGDVSRAARRDFFKLPLDSLPPNDDGRYRDLIPRLHNLEWYEFYDFFEFVALTLPDLYRDGFVAACNEVLAREMSAYRFVGAQLTPITDEQELSTVEEALDAPDAFAPARQHLAAALGHMSDRETPDFRNSVKESISAVEAICRILLKDAAVTLGRALPKVSDKYGLHRAWGTAFSNLYGYTSDSGGIRHSLSNGDEVTPSFEDAKFVLVACSAFVNYLIAKSSDA